MPYLGSTPISESEPSTARPQTNHRTLDWFGGLVRTSIGFGFACLKKDVKWAFGLVGKHWRSHQVQVKQITNICNMQPSLKLRQPKLEHRAEASLPPWRIDHRMPFSGTRREPGTSKNIFLAGFPHTVLPEKHSYFNSST